jgi:hypothetical protein
MSTFNNAPDPLQQVFCRLSAHSNVFTSCPFKPFATLGILQPEEFGWVSEGVEACRLFNHLSTFSEQREETLYQKTIQCIDLRIRLR